MGRKCPGPRTGAYFVVYGSPESDGLDPNKNFNGDKPTRPKCTVQMPLEHRGLRAEAFDQLFFAHFFESGGRGVETIQACSWLSKLPLLISTSHNCHALRYSVRATCMAFYAVTNGTVSLLQAARSSYTRALENHRRDMTHLHSRSQADSALSDQAICASIMMGYFEMVASHTSLAWMVHFDAAAAMLERRGLVACSESPFTHQLFRTVRLGATFISIVRRRPHFFSKEPWTSVTPADQRTALDVLVDILLSIPVYIELYDLLPPETSNNGTLIDKTLQGVQDLVERLLLAQDFLTDSTTSMNGNHVAPPRKRSTPSHPPDPLPGLLRGMRNASLIICFALIYGYTAEEEARKQAVFYSDEVLRAVKSFDITSQSQSNKIFICTILPLYIVADWSPSASHTHQAAKLLDDNDDSHKRVPSLKTHIDTLN